MLKAIRDWGHEIGLHYEPEFAALVGEEARDLLRREKAALEAILEVEVVSAAAHNPSLSRESLSLEDLAAVGIRHEAYHTPFSTEFKYLSDSGARWREGCVCGFLGREERLHVLIGGGGGLSPGAVLTMGDRCLLVDYTYVNLADAVAIGHGTALSYHVTVLTHGVWQPVLEGYGAKMAPVRLGDDVVIYSNSTVLPGVTVGDGATVGACSLVHRDVPPRTFAAGVPARVVRDASEYPRRLTPTEKAQRVLDILDRYVETLPYKGYEVRRNALRTEGEVVVEGPAGRFQVVWVPPEVENVEERLAEFLAACGREGVHPIVVSLSPLPALEGATRWTSAAWP